MAHYWRLSKVKSQEGVWRLSARPVVVEALDETEAATKINLLAADWDPSTQILAEEFGSPQGPCDTGNLAWHKAIAAYTDLTQRVPLAA